MVGMNTIRACSEALVLTSVCLAWHQTAIRIVREPDMRARLAGFLSIGFSFEAAVCCEDGIRCTTRRARPGLGTPKRHPKPGNNTFGCFCIFRRLKNISCTARYRARIEICKAHAHNSSAHAQICAKSVNNT